MDGSDFLGSRRSPRASFTWPRPAISCEVVMFKLFAVLLLMVLAGCSAFKQSVSAITFGVAFQEPDTTAVDEPAEEVDE